jgi:kinesin family protein 5
MQGLLENPELQGIIPRMLSHVFHHIDNVAKDTNFVVKVAMVEIYMEKIKDLLNPVNNNMAIREEKGKGVYIEDLKEVSVDKIDEVLQLMEDGLKNRAVAYTDMNATSSRSHSIFILTIQQTNVRTLVNKTGKLYLVDLAGSEKASKTK